MHPCFRSASWHSGGSAAGWSVDMVGAISSMESSKDAKHSDVLESKGSLANKMPSDRRASLLSSDEAGLRVPEPPGSTGVVIHSDTAAEMGQKSSSSSSSPSSAQSSRSSEFSLPGFQKEKYPEEFSLLKSQTKDGQRPEWTFYPRFSSNVHTYHVGKQCFFSGVFQGNRRSVAEQTVDKSLGRKRYDIDPRNGIPKLTPGDNPYMLPEQSKEFFKAGATLPPVNFSLIPYEKKFDTFIPLEPLPQIPNLPFWEKEKANNLKNEIKEVKELDNWHPPPPFLHSFFSSGPEENQILFGNTVPSQGTGNSRNETHRDELKKKKKKNYNQNHHKEGLVAETQARLEQEDETPMNMMAQMIQHPEQLQGY